jgi:uncharacterized membrane protein YeiH
MNPEFHLPVLFDLCATFAFALTGALAGIRRGYDIVGVFFLALVSGLGGGLIRDGIFIQNRSLTPLLTDPRYVELVAAATIIGAVAGNRVNRFQRLIAILDALGLGAYAVFGTQKALHAGLDAPAAVLVGVINAAGGGLLRDIITREEPLVFKPGQFYVLTALLGSVAFVFLVVTMNYAPSTAGLIAVVLTTVFRMLAIAFNWQTRSVKEFTDVFP